MYRRARKPRSGRRAAQVGVAIAVVAVAWWLWPESWDLPQDGASADGRVADLGGADEGDPSRAEDELVAGVTGELRDDRPETARPELVMGEATPAPPETNEARAPDPQRPPVSTSTQSPPTAGQRTPDDRIAAAPQRTIAPSRPRGNDRASLRMDQGLDLISRNRPLEARRVLSDLLRANELSEAQAQAVRDSLRQVNDRLVFSPYIEPGDPFALTYEVAGGDALARIPRRRGLQTDWRFIQRVNGIHDPTKIQAGQPLKLVTGPFHAVVVKHAYRLDLYLGEWSDRVYVRSFPVGLGSGDSTPVGGFTVGTKDINPEWYHPTTHQRYKRDDPSNPIGERWIGLDADDPGISGYGIHGTIEPESIGRQASMGCVRLSAPDVELIYEVLMTGVSRVEITP